jgi:hypothetical protein
MFHVIVAHHTFDWQAHGAILSAGMAVGALFFLGFERWKRQ